MGGKTKLLEAAVAAIAHEASHRPLLDSVDAAKRNMLVFAGVLKDIEKLTVEAGNTRWPLSHL
jgi:hypothetical protein